MLRTILAISLLFCLKSSIAAVSTCYGSVNHGRLEHGVKLPASGANFSAYSQLGAAIGRTHVHQKVLDVVVQTYRQLEQSAPGKVFVYGETGWAQGGRFRPHRTHQNGLSVDFMVPVTDGSHHSTTLPAGATNKFGYGIEFDANGQYLGYHIDFEAMAAHLSLLQKTAAAQGVGINLVIFDPRLMPKLFQTRQGAKLKNSLRFMKGEAWVRHDDHYHVNFSIPCKPL